jgi:hypothetical protein
MLNRKVQWLSLNYVFVLPSILLFLNFLDSVTTVYGLSNGLVETNPLFSWEIMPAKSICCGVLFVTSYLQSRISFKGKILQDGVICSMIIFYLFVVCNNTLLILSL